MTSKDYKKIIKEKDELIDKMGVLLLDAHCEMKKLEPLLKRKGLSLAFHQFNAQLQESVQGVLKNVGPILDAESKRSGTNDGKVSARSK